MELSKVTYIYISAPKCKLDDMNNVLHASISHIDLHAPGHVYMTIESVFADAS
jgi:hypothetical protein